MIATETQPSETAPTTPPPATAPLTLCVTDVTGQKKMKIRVAAGDTDTTVGELIDNLLPRMGLPAMADGRPLPRPPDWNEKAGTCWAQSVLPSRCVRTRAVLLSPGPTPGDQTESEERKANGEPRLLKPGAS